MEMMNLETRIIGIVNDYTGKLMYQRKDSNLGFGSPEYCYCDSIDVFSLDDDPFMCDYNVNFNGKTHVLNSRNYSAISIEVNSEEKNS